MLRRPLKTIKLIVDESVENEFSGKKVAEETVGSVTVPIFHSPTRVLVRLPSDGNGDGSATVQTKYKTYDSYVITYYEGSVRQTRRRSTLEKARKFANEIATRINRDGAKAIFLSEKDRRVMILAKAAAGRLGMEVDELCRKFVELNSRLKEGTLERAVDFFNDHGQRVRHGVANTEIYEEYLAHLEKRGVGYYHMRDTKRYVSPFIDTYPRSISPIQTPDIDAYLGCLKGKARSKNNVRDAIIGFFNFAQEKGYLPQGIPHAASLTTEFRDARQKIESEDQALALLAPNDIYLPDEMRRLLVACREHEPKVLPSLELKAFSGVRTEEMVRIWWVMVREREEMVRIPDAVGKVDARRVPILPNLKQRLAAHPNEIKSGRVAVNWTIANSLYHAWKRVCDKAGVPYRRNAFRNSYFTYRLAILGDIDLVAQEGGTSAGELKKNYLSRAPISRPQAEEWFSL